VIVRRFLAVLEALILERQPDGTVVAHGDLPAWCGRLRREWPIPREIPFVAEDAFPFLSVFLPDAEEAWRREPPTRAESDIWTEVDRGGNELHLEATALRVEQTCVLVIMPNDRLFVERQTLLQRARELRMTHSALMKEIEQKDILVHAIVHDLAAPLHSIMGVLSLLGEEPLGEPSANWVRLATQAAARQRALITEILDVFSAEGGELATRSAGGVALADVLGRVVAEREPVARRRNLRLEADVPSASTSMQVVAEETRLFRVLTNLIDNAYRHSPTGGLVRVATRREDGSTVVSVEDEGPGVSADVLPHLFEKFARGREPGAGTGLGLFYCRITVENWGGAIGYESRETGGARFWIRLRGISERERER
jgi:signal transduction histidine kinase